MIFKVANIQPLFQAKPSFLAVSYDMHVYLATSYFRYYSKGNVIVVAISTFKCLLYIVPSNQLKAESMSLQYRRAVLWLLVVCPS